MALWKLAGSYFVPAFIFLSLLCSSVFSQIGLLEKWVFGDNKIHQIVPPPVDIKRHNSNPLNIDDEAGLLWSNNGFHAGDEDSLRTAQLTAKAISIGLGTTACQQIQK